jgi:hypothetical protein
MHKLYSKVMCLGRQSAFLSLGITYFAQELRCCPTKGFSCYRHHQNVSPQSLDVMASSARLVLCESLTVYL